MMLRKWMFSKVWWALHRMCSRDQHLRDRDRQKLDKLWPSTLAPQSLGNHRIGKPSIISDGEWKQALKIEFSFQDLFPLAFNFDLVRLFSMRWKLIGQVGVWTESNSDAFQLAFDRLERHSGVVRSPSCSEFRVSRTDLGHYFSRWGSNCGQKIARESIDSEWFSLRLNRKSVGFEASYSASATSDFAIAGHSGLPMCLERNAFRSMAWRPPGRGFAPPLDPTPWRRLVYEYELIEFTRWARTSTRGWGKEVGDRGGVKPRPGVWYY